MTPNGRPANGRPPCGSGGRGPPPGLSALATSPVACFPSGCGTRAWGGDWRDNNKKPGATGAKELKSDARGPSPGGAHALLS